ncbi:hypothetical protein ASE78_17640 [Sphingomonas sp. Leaf25]|nr:hypothetical protein ASE78_17640 [Sphingomonas sp. Leaf25]
MKVDHYDDGVDARPIRRLNLNLLYALDAILRSRTLTEAGRSVSLSQPAMSMSLRRLRDHFRDELVLYRGADRQLTALGEALRPHIARVMRDVTQAFGLSLDFDPLAARRSISIAADEAIELMFLRSVVPDILRAGPGLDVRLAPFHYGSVDRMFDEGVDIAIVPEMMAGPTTNILPLFDHGLVGMICDRHPTFGDSLSLREYRDGRHAALVEDAERIASFAQSDTPPFSDRRIVVRTGHCAMLPHLVIGTDLIVTASNWLTQYFASILPVRLVDLPVPGELMRMVAAWPEHRSNDPLIHWLLDRIVDRIDWLNAPLPRYQRR